MLTASLIQKAALLLDLRGDAPGAIRVLREAISVADGASEHLVSVEARVFLADVLFRQRGNSTEIEALLHAARRLAREHVVEHDLVSPHLTLASELLSHFEPQGGPRVPEP